MAGRHLRYLPTRQWMWIVSDVMMPEMNGLELTAKVKSDIEYSHIPVILLTAKTTLEAKVEGFECGADVYIEKPFSIRQLRKQIENLLKLRQAFHKMMAELSGGNGASPISPVEYSVSQKDCELMAKVRAAVEGTAFGRELLCRYTGRVTQYEPFQFLS